MIIFLTETAAGLSVYQAPIRISCLLSPRLCPTVKPSFLPSFRLVRIRRRATFSLCSLNKAYDSDNIFEVQKKSWRWYPVGPPHDMYHPEVFLECILWAFLYFLDESVLLSAVGPASLSVPGRYYWNTYWSDGFLGHAELFRYPHP